MQPSRPDSNSRTNRHYQYNLNQGPNTTNTDAGYFAPITKVTLHANIEAATNLASVNNSTKLPLLRDGLRCHAKLWERLLKKEIKK